MKILFVFCFVLAQISAWSQPTRREIIENRIMSVEATVYNKSGAKMNVQKNYYSVRGSDSVELNNEKPAFTFREELDGMGRVRQLTTPDAEGRDDEIHIYEYSDADYTIEVIAHGAGTISLATYNSKHDRIEEVESSTDTFYFSNNKLGKIAKVAQKDSGRTIDIAVTEFDAKGFPVAIRPLDNSPYLMRFVYNDQGLPVEQKRLKMNNSQEQLILKTVYTYEFRSN